MKKTYISPEFSLEGLIDDQSVLMVSVFDTNVEPSNNVELGARESGFSAGDDDNVGW